MITNISTADVTTYEDIKAAINNADNRNDNAAFKIAFNELNTFIEAMCNKYAQVNDQIDFEDFAGLGVMTINPSEFSDVPPMVTVA
jgi:hypothetical protein